MYTFSTVRQQRRRGDISSQPAREESLPMNRTKDKKNAIKTAPKKLVLSLSSSRPTSYAAAATDTSSPSPATSNYTITTPSSRSQSTFSPNSTQFIPSTPYAPSRLPPLPLIQAEKLSRITRPQSFFKLGMILEAPLMEEDFMYGSSLNRNAVAASDSSSAARAYRENLSISASHYGYVHTKLRKFVVVGLFAQHYVAVPMYTHNGGGLEKKPNKNEFVSVRDAREEEGDEALSDHGMLVADMLPEAMKVYEKTTVHFTYAVSRCYHLKVHYWGDLEKKSRERLLRLYREYILGGTVSSD